MTTPPPTRFDGPRDGGVRVYPSDVEPPSSTEVWRQCGACRAPVLRHADNPHEYLFIALFDGTGSDVARDPDHATNIGLIRQQLKQHPSDRIVSKYISGPGTQSSLIPRFADTLRGHTADERVEQMYKRFAGQAALWIHADPQATISLAGLGFSRGAEEVVLLTRLIEERGIQDPDGAHYQRDRHGQIRQVEYTRPPLVPPHEVAQVVVLFDPVAAGWLQHADRRLPPSVVSGVQIEAMDEHRRAFKVDRIIDPGLSADGRFFGVALPGAHGDVGRSYPLDGLGNIATNVGIALINAVGDGPILTPLPEIGDPARNLIHYSVDHHLVYGIDYKVDRATAAGHREVLVDRQQIRNVVDARNAEPRETPVEASFDLREIGPAGEHPAALPMEPSPSLTQLIDRLYRAAITHDAKAMDAVVADYLETPSGRTWQQQVRETVALQVPDLILSPLQPER